MTFDDLVFDQTNTERVLCNGHYPALSPGFLRFCIQSYIVRSAHDSYYEQHGNLLATAAGGNARQPGQCRDS